MLFKKTLEGLPYLEQVCLIAVKDQFCMVVGLQAQDWASNCLAPLGTCVFRGVSMRIGSAAHCTEAGIREFERTTE